jgi:hypothetical protein
VEHGVLTFLTDYGIDGPTLARAVEERGFDGLFLTEHTHIPVSRESPWSGGPELPRRYVHCTVKPGGDSFARFADAARTDPTWRLDTIPTGHDVMISAPDALATLLTDRSTSQQKPQLTYWWLPACFATVVSHQTHTPPALRTAP